MASIKIKFRPSRLESNEETVYYQINHGRQTRQVASRIRISQSEWEQVSSQGDMNANPDDDCRQASLKSDLRQDVELFSKILDSLNRRGVKYSAENVALEYKRYLREYTLSAFMERIIEGLEIAGKIRTAETYRAALRNFMQFRDGNDIMFHQFTPAVAEAFEQWNRGRGLTRNSISFYNRILRAVYNRSVEEGLTDNLNPFRRCYTGIDRTVKRAIPMSVIKRLKSLRLESAPALDYARDMFMMSFYLRGMSFIDMAYLRKRDLKRGYVTYRRQKTGQMLMVGWTREMQEILDKYPVSDPEFLLPILNSSRADLRTQYKNKGYNINRNLKKLGVMLGLDEPLTLYVARHSWASAARSKGVPISVISEGMGHNSETTTRIYLASLDMSAIDKANAMIISCLK